MSIAVLTPANSAPQPFIPGKRLEDGTDINNALAQPVVSTLTGQTAVGTNLATALPLTATINQIAVAAAGTGVALANLLPGQSQTVYNDGASAIKVYSANATIDGVAGATGVTLTNGNRCAYTCLQSGIYNSAQLGVVSS